MSVELCEREKVGFVFFFVC